MRATTWRRDVQWFSFPNRNVELRNRLEGKGVCARNIQDYKEYLDKRHGGGAARRGSSPRVTTTSEHTGKNN